ncbi:LysR family transcriptional regulator, hydrogen peroxide-inducible genes activator [Lishizhenia tianjinensis]|uniref:LysR family transcriptional regulator, hydrogen peroxide-inducible genes activator n=1 Tax=Lishizhenia tianjinensis TaxID=477690 RepID=A0A1I6XQH4_9FLAO|nr:LysR family transcriptional regulator [Lishizhenia tianjinensis]SFT40685.1 LysR family transcriptional regulator, hydrogen peroxide-inducible genes activator [Lishizhenia tianjinensis]
MISHAQIQYIIHVYQEKSFQKAADKCFVTQPTLSMQIKKAEQTLGYPIFNRDTNPICLTSFGEELMPRLFDIEESFQKLDIFIQQKEGKYQEEIKLGIIPTVSIYMVPYLYKVWDKEFPNVNLKIVELPTEKLLQAVGEKKVDAGIMAGPVPGERFDDCILFNEEIKIYAPQYEGNGVLADDLKNMKPWLLSKGNCLRTQMINFCALKQEEKSSWDYEGGNLELLTKMAKLHGGFTLLPEYYLQMQPKLQKTVLTAENPAPARSIVGFHLPRNTKRVNIQKIYNVLKKGYPQPSDKKLNILPWK